MASHNRSQSMLGQYTQLNTIPAIVGIIFAVAAGVQFLDVTITIGIVSYTFDPAHAMFVGFGALVVAFASSDTKDWRFYDTWEQGLVAVAVVLMISGEYVAEVATILSNNQPVAGIIAFAISMAAWGVLAR